MRKWFELIIPILAGAVMAALSFAGLRNVEWRIYDVFLRLKPPIEESDSILLLVVDDTTISNINTYPIGREYMAEGLLLLREFGASYTTFDVEFIDKSPRGIDANFLNGDLANTFRLKFSELEQNMVALFEALQDERIALDEANIYIEDLAALNAAGMDYLLEEVSRIERDNDQFLGQASTFFGNTYLTINMLDWRDATVTDDLREYAKAQLSLQNIEIVNDAKLSVAVDIKPAILPIIGGGKGAGFPKVVVDPDGVQRRVDLIHKFEDAYFPQLGFSSLLDWLGNPKITVLKNKLEIEGAQHPWKGEIDISIPLTTNSKFLINSPKKLFEDSFAQLSYYTLVYHDILLADLLSNLQIMENEGYLSFYSGSFPLLALYGEIESLKEQMMDEGDVSGMADYQQYRGYFFDEVGGFVGGPASAQIQDEYGRLLDSADYTDDQKADIRELMVYADQVFSATAGIHEKLVGIRDELQKNVDKKFVIVGYTGTSTTDIGVNPFQEKYMNVGTHASVVNTILQGEFLDDVPWWYSLIAGFLFSTAAALVLRRMNPIPSLSVGAAFVVAVLVGLFLIFRFTGIYINTLTPAMYMFLTVLAVSVTKFLRTEKEKGYIKNAFSRYLSDDVISDLLSDPGKLNLGGEKKRLTALFTDVKGFSAISEQLDPQDLVGLLNQYLTEMSDVVLKQRGTIDKYEGDAIICFFGAPVQYEDHAERACYTAVKMKSLEVELNKRIVAEGLTPTPLLTRIGINTGDIVVGNMGTQKKMDYTMMGAAVNVAARLEGVNKQYGTWVLITEPTYNECGEDYATRKLDRIRVVGMKEPIRLYELIDKIQFTPKVKLDTMAMFAGAVDLFEERKWEKAKQTFQEILKIDADDVPSKFYINRCDTLQKSPPPDNWDGVFNLKEK